MGVMGRGVGSGGFGVTLKALRSDKDLIGLGSKLQHSIGAGLLPGLDGYRHVGDGQPDVRNADGIFTGRDVGDSEIPLGVGHNLPASRQKFDQWPLQGGIPPILQPSSYRPLSRLSAE